MYSKLDKLSIINFIDSTATTMLLKGDAIDYHLAFTSAHALIGSITGDKIFVKTYKGLLSADMMCLVISESGTDKTGTHGPIDEFLLKMGLSIPATFTTESLPFYFDKTVTTKHKNEDDEEVEETKYMYKNYGLIFWDEASGVFSEAENKKNKSGTIELLSSVYNHTFKRTFIKDSEKCVRNPQKPYISLLGNMVPWYFPDIPDLFFAQGTAGRIHWCFPDTKKPKEIEKQPDWNNYNNFDKYKSEFNEIENKIYDFNDELQALPEPLIVLIDDDANKLIKEFKHQTEVEWFSSLTENPYGWDWQYFKRLPEMACKAALRYAIGDNIDDIKKLNCINKIQMQRGIDFASDSSDALQRLFTLRNSRKSKCKPELRAMRALMDATNQMLNNQQWQKTTGITNNVSFQKIRDKLITDQKVVEINKDSITNDEEKIRLGTKNTVKIFKWVGK
jgi:hypothetical protein